MNKVVIIGSRGQDGQLLYQSQVEKGNWVLGIHRGGVDTNLATWKNISVHLSERHEVERMLETVQPDHLYYLAAYHHSAEEQLPDNVELLEKSFQVNSVYLAGVLEGVRKTSPNTHVFYACSSHVFGNASEKPQNENTQFNPINIYGIAKLSGLYLVRFYRESYKLNISTGILYNHESSLRPNRFLSKKVVEKVVKIKRGLEKELVLGDLQARVDWGYAPDFVVAMEEIVKLSAPDDYVVATGEEHTVKELVEIAFEMVGLSWQKYVREVPGTVKGNNLPLVGDASRLRKHTNWKTTLSFKEMIQEMVRAEMAK